MNRAPFILTSLNSILECLYNIYVTLRVDSKWQLGHLGKCGQKKGSDTFRERSVKIFKKNFAYL